MPDPYTFKVAISLLPHAVSIPKKSTKHSSGYDLMAAIPGGDILLISPGERKLIPTGIRLAIPPGYEAQIRPRSGLAFNQGVTVLNTPGTIDVDYRGECGVILINTDTDNPFAIKRGDRIAQLVFVPICNAEFEVVRELPSTDRGEGGFGSTGVQERKTSPLPQGWYFKRSQKASLEDVSDAINAILYQTKRITTGEFSDAILCLSAWNNSGKAPPLGFTVHDGKGERIQFHETIIGGDALWTLIGHLPSEKMPDTTYENRRMSISSIHTPKATNWIFDQALASRLSDVRSHVRTWISLLEKYAESLPEDSVDEPNRLGSSDKSYAQHELHAMKRDLGGLFEFLHPGTDFTESPKKTPVDPPKTTEQDYLDGMKLQLNKLLETNLTSVKDAAQALTILRHVWYDNLVPSPSSVFLRRDSGDKYFIDYRWDKIDTDEQRKAFRGIETFYKTIEVGHHLVGVPSDYLRALAESAAQALSDDMLRATWTLTEAGTK